MLKYYGYNKKKNYFEGWYFKIVQKDNQIAFIPGISIDESGNRQAFIQVITNDKSYYIDYQYEDVSFDFKHSVLKIDKNIFSEKGIRINIENEELCIQGKIGFKELIPIKYDIMGIFSKTPFMECRHGIISLHQKLYGTLYLNQNLISFDHGTGYIETDRGSSFPKSYFWTQCNYFGSEVCGVVAAVADIPFLGFHFKGCICIVYYQKTEYRLATYLGVKILKQNSRCLWLKQGKYMLKIFLLKDNPMKLLAPKSGNMSLVIHESVSCRVRYCFYENKKLIFDYTSDYAGFEYVN